METPEPPTPRPVTYKFTVDGEDIYDIEVRAEGMAKAFFDDVPYQLNIEVHKTPDGHTMQYRAHVDAIRKINWRQYN